MLIGHTEDSVRIYLFLYFLSNPKSFFLRVFFFTTSYPYFFIVYGTKLDHSIKEYK